MRATVKSLPPDFDMHDNNYTDNVPFAASGGTVPYAIPVPQSQQQQQQQHAQHSQHPPPPQPHHKHNYVVPMGPPGGLAGGGSGMTTGSGPSVPAPRSTATLLAEATGAPPPPPAPTRFGNVHTSMNAAAAAAAAASAVSNSGLAVPTTAAGGVGGVPAAMLAAVASLQHQQQQQQQQHPQVLAPPPSATSAPPSFASSAAAAARVSPNSAPSLGNADTADGAAPPVTSTFQAFTPAAAAMLESMAGAEPVGSTAPAGPVSSTNHAQAVAAAPAAVRVTPANPYAKIEVKFSVPAAAKSACDMWGKDVDDENEDSTTNWIMGLLKSTSSTAKSALAAQSKESLMEDFGVEWYSQLLEYKDPRVTAAAFQARLNRLEGNNLRFNLEKLAGAIVTHQMWAVAPFLSPRLRHTLRHLVLRSALKQLLDFYEEPASADRYAAVLAKMMNIGWLTVAGAATLVDQLLQHPQLGEVGLRTAATLLHDAQSTKAVRAALEARPRIARRLATLYETSPALDVDVAMLCRWWRGIPATLSASVSLLHTAETPGAGRAPVTTMAYFGVRDEFVSGDMSGAVTLWGPPSPHREKSFLEGVYRPSLVVHPRGVVPLPMNCVPVAMAGQRLDGQYLAIAGMPLKGRKPYAEYNAAPRQPTAGSATSTPVGALPSTSATTPAGSLAPGAIIVVTCNENSIRWNKGEIIMRPPGVAITAITAFRNSIVAVGESVVSCAAPGPAVADPSVPTPHRLSFVDVVQGTVMRRVPKAHDDFITALTVLEESSYVLLSGGRDAAVKLWDPRSREDCPVVNTALCTDAPHHTTTISSLHTYGFNILSTDIDGVVAVWDLRNMAAPQLQHALSCPIADATLLHANRAALATSRGIVLVALDTLRPLDLCHKTGVCSHVLANDAGTVLFTASGEKLEMMAVGDV